MAKSTKAQAQAKAKANKQAQSITNANKKKLRDRTQELLNNHMASVALRVKGSKKHDKGNVGFKQTPCEVFVFIVIADEQLRAEYQERFKNTRNFKKTIAFENVEQLQQYLVEYKFPKMSIFLAVIDCFFENMSEDEQSVAIAAMKKLQQQDPSTELIMLSELHDSPTVKTNTPYGLVTYIKKTAADSFKQILNCMILAIHEHNKIRKQYDTKQMLKKGSIAAGILLVLMLIADFIAKGKLLGVLPYSLFE